MHEASIRLTELIQSRSACVAVIGLEDPGIERMKSLFTCGFRAFGFDFEIPKESTRNAEWHKTHDHDFDITLQPERLADADILLIHTPILFEKSRSPNLVNVQRVLDVVRVQLRPGHLIVLEATAYPGMTREVLFLSLEKRGLRVGSDYFLACSPEGRKRIIGAPASPLSKVVAGIEPHSTELVKRFFESLDLSVVVSSSMEIAEACPIMQDAFYAVDRALVNELRPLFRHMRVDLAELLALWRRMIGTNPQNGFADMWTEAIPRTPFFFSWMARKYGLTSRMIEVAGEIGENMSAYLVDRIEEGLNEQSKCVKGSKILFIGVSAIVDQESTGLGTEVLARLSEKGADLRYHHRCPIEFPGRSFSQQTCEPLLNEETLRSSDLVLILAPSPDYDWNWIVQKCQLIVDCCNATHNVSEHRERIVLI